ncbi:MAG: 1,4-dihydroxy-6-naphthoate synthase [Pseudomonadota bacterium]
MSAAAPAPRELTFGFSPCPNDTFAFHALAHGLVGAPGVAIRPFLADVEELNRRALGAELPLTKLSFHALAHVQDRYVLLRAGAALGRGCGPLVVARPQDTGLDLSAVTIAVPGRLTTAHLLLSLYLAKSPAVEPLIFSEIMPAVAAGKFRAGLIIHEGRFTYQEHGLVQLIDLGQWWEQTTGLPIPLGCIAARRDPGRETGLALERALAESVRAAWAEPAASRGYVRAHAQELEPAVLQGHIDLYVNRFTADLGQEGLHAVAEALARGRAAGLLPASDLPLTW